MSEIEYPVLIPDYEYKAVFGNLNYSAVIQGAENDTLKYRVLLNDIVLEDWTDYLQTPVNLTLSILYASLKDSNTLVIEYIDSSERSGVFEVNFSKKNLETVYMDSNEKYPYDDKLKVGDGYITYIKVPKPENIGYVKNITLNLEILSNDEETGEIKIAPVTSEWTINTISPQSSPAIDIDNEITIEVTNIESMLNIDISNLVYGSEEYESIAIYSTEHSIEFSSVNVSVDYTYQPTVLLLPKQTLINNVPLSWKPLILEKPDAFKKLAVKRSINSSFEPSTAVFQTQNSNVSSCTDNNVSEGEYYYKVEVEMEQLEYNGDQLDFDEEDESKFIKQDPDKINFNGGAVKLEGHPQELINLPLEQSIYDEDYIEATASCVILKEIE